MSRVAVASEEEQKDRVGEAGRPAPPSQRARENQVMLLPLLALFFWRLAARAARETTTLDWVLEGFGLALLVVGIGIRIYGRQWKAEHRAEGLVKDGLYGWVRHPLYLGSFLLGLGICLVMGEPILLGGYLILFWASHWQVIRREEQELEALFGAEYRDYRRAVPALLPRPDRPGGRITPRHLWHGVVREGDALCAWLAAPLVIHLVEWLGVHRATTLHSPDWWVPALLSFGIGCLAAFLVRLKMDYRDLMRQEKLAAATAPPEEAAAE